MMYVIGADGRRQRQAEPLASTWGSADYGRGHQRAGGADARERGHAIGSAISVRPISASRAVPVIAPAAAAIAAPTAPWRGASSRVKRQLYDRQARA